MKKILGVLVVGLFLAGMSKMAHAAFANMDLNVTITSNMAVSIIGSTNTPVSVGLGGSAVAGGGITFRNTSDTGVAPITYRLRSYDTFPWVLTATTTAPGFNEYGLRAKFNTTAPASGAFSDTDDVLTTATIDATATKFAGNQNGVDVPINGDRTVWVKILAPSSSNAIGARTIAVTLEAFLP